MEKRSPHLGGNLDGATLSCDAAVDSTPSWLRLSRLLTANGPAR